MNRAGNEGNSQGNGYGAWTGMSYAKGIEQQLSSGTGGAGQRAGERPANMQLVQDWERRQAAVYSRTIYSGTPLSSVATGHNPPHDAATFSARPAHPRQYKSPPADPSLSKYTSNAVHSSIPAHAPPYGTSRPSQHPSTFALPRASSSSSQSLPAYTAPPPPQPVPVYQAPRAPLPQYRHQSIPSTSSVPHPPVHPPQPQSYYQPVPPAPTVPPHNLQDGRRVAVAAPSASQPVPTRQPAPVQMAQKSGSNNATDSTGKVEKPRKRYRALFKIREGMGHSEIELVARVNKEILMLAEAGGFAIELGLEGLTLPLLRQARLPTSQPALDAWRSQMREHLAFVPGVTTETFLETFLAWSQFVGATGNAIFPICGTTAAAFLGATTPVGSPERVKRVWCLEHYRRATSDAFQGLGRDPVWRTRLEGNWKDEDWMAWDRFVELSRVRLLDWTIIRELVNLPLANSASTNGSTSTPNTTANAAQAPDADSAAPPQQAPPPAPDSFAPRKDPIAKHASEKALGKRRAGDPDQFISTVASSASVPINRTPPPVFARVASEVIPAGSPVHPYGFDKNGLPRRKPYKKRKLPPEERKADEAFYVALRECDEALDRAKARIDAANAEEEARTVAPVASGSTIAPTVQVLPASREKATTTLPAPFSDYFPSLSTHISKPILAPLDPPPVLSLSFHPARSTPLSADLPPLVLSSTGVLEQDTSIDFRPRLTLTPHQFLPYPESLTLPSRLSDEQRYRTFKFAQDLGKTLVDAGNARDADERQRQRKEYLTQIVGTAIAHSQPMQVVLTVGGEMYEPREPAAAVHARNKARRKGIEANYCFPARSEQEVEQRRERAIMLGTVTSNAEKESEVVLEGEVVPDIVVDQLSQEARAKDARPTVRTGKRKAMEDDTDATDLGKFREDESAMRARKRVSSTGPAPSREAGDTQTRHVAPPAVPPVVPTVSISPSNDPPPSKATNPPSPSVSTDALKPSPTPNRRPSLSPSSVSAPVVPQQLERSRSKSVSREPPTHMRRRTSITNAAPGVHPLALLYASQSPQYRQGARLKAAEIVAATKSGIIPAAKSPLIAAKVLAEGAVLPRNSPRIGLGGSSLAKSPRVGLKPLSPPLVPIPVEAGKEGEKRDAPEAEGKNDASPTATEVKTTFGDDDFDRLHPPSISSDGSSALGVILELPSPRPPSAISPAQKAPPLVEPSKPDPIPPIPIPEISRPSPPAPPPTSVAETSPPHPPRDPVQAPSPTKTSTFSRFVGRISSGFGRLVGSASSSSSSIALEPDHTETPTADKNAAASAEPTSRPDPESAPPEKTRVEPTPPRNDGPDANGDSTMNENVQVTIQTKRAGAEATDSDSDAKRKRLNERGLDVKGKGKQRAIESSSPVMTDPRRQGEPRSSSVAAPKKKSESFKPVSREKGKPRGNSVASKAPLGPLNDHPLRHVPKWILAANEPIFPFGRLPSPGSD